MILFLCIICSPKYEEIAKQLPDSYVHKGKCADCGRTDLGHEYCVGRTSPKSKRPKRGHVGKP